MQFPEIEWKPVSRAQLIGWLVFYALLLLYLALHWGQLTLLDNVHLRFTKAAIFFLAGWVRPLDCGAERCCS